MNKNVFLVNKNVLSVNKNVLLMIVLVNKTVLSVNKNVLLMILLVNKTVLLVNRNVLLMKFCMRLFFYKFICKFQWPIVGNITFALRSFLVFHLFLRNFGFNGYFDL